MIIDGSYFTGVLSLGIIWNIDDDSITRKAERDNLQSYIDLYEKKYLRMVLGKSMSREFIEYILSSDNDVDKWEKLKEKLSNKGYSPVANYVYFHYVRRCVIKQTPVGTVYASGDEKANPNILLVSAWNDMVQMNKDLYDFLESDKEYEGFSFNCTMLECINGMGI
ncbi:uncharacterized protein BN535_02193 [Bacteroides caccae CAG:21]|jgi:hypothetical protein|nr:uncharacterized protein BN535_02193 [Bacteroides caccae CAG:21]